MFKALLLRDLKTGIRSGGGFGLGLAFYAVVALFVPFAVGPDKQILSQIAPGVFWVAALLAGLLALERLFQLDYEDGSLEQLLLSPLAAEFLFIGKAIIHWLINMAPLLIATPLFGLMYGLSPGGLTWLLISLVLGSPSISLIGTFGAAITAGLQRGGLLLSLLVLPLYAPVLIFGAEAARRGAENNDPLTPLLLLSAINLLALALMPLAGAAALKAGMRQGQS